MKTIRQLLLAMSTLFFVGCGTETSSPIDPNRGFDMWEYMTSPLNYEVEYAVYENEAQTDYYTEVNRVFDEGNTYERKSDTGRTTLYLNGNSILMKEPTEDVDISRYVNLGDRGIFRSASIDLCVLERFYDNYTIHGSSFKNVLLVNCVSKRGVKQEYYYGYSEGIVAINQDDGENRIEYVKVNEKRIF